MKFTLAAIILAAAGPAVLALPATPVTEPPLTTEEYQADGDATTEVYRPPGGKQNCAYWRFDIICARDLAAEADVSKREANFQAAIAENPAITAAELAARGYAAPAEGQCTYYTDGIVCKKTVLEARAGARADARAAAAVEVDKREGDLAARGYTAPSRGCTNIAAPCARGLGDEAQDA